MKSKSTKAVFVCAGCVRVHSALLTLYATGRMELLKPFYIYFACIVFVEMKFVAKLPQGCR